jgi:adenylate cyclase class IV
MKNIELKISLENFKEINKLLLANQAKKTANLKQVDTYYNCKNGRLKLREINNEEFQLIYYSRPDTLKSKVSTFTVLKINADQFSVLKGLLAGAYGEKVAVKKERVLWIYKNTRIHLDKVYKLGYFLELETVVNGIFMEEAHLEHQEVIKKLELDKYKKIDKSYSDMILKPNINKT